MSKQKQMRRTFIDCINNQHALLELVKRKIRNNAGLFDKEKTTFSAEVSNAVQAFSLMKVTYITTSGREIDLGNIDEVVDILLNQKGTRAKITDMQSMKSFIVSYTEIWSCFEKTLIHIFPLVKKEAIRMSAETTVREEAGSFKFDAKTMDK